MTRPFDPRSSSAFLRTGTVALACACTFVACDRAAKPLSPTPKQAPAHTEAAAELIPASSAEHRWISYPKARWRLAPFDEVDRVVVWVSHILIAHEQSQMIGLLRRPGWTPDGPPPARSRDAALELARKIATQAHADPSRFAELARRHSDDVVTRERGGSLGGSRASQLPHEFVDAIAQLKPGEVSGVFETTFGYHVLLRRPAPERFDVSGRRIVVRYNGASDYAATPEANIERARADAEALARRIVVEARDPGNSFETLVAKYSEHLDRIRQGDVGVWSTWNPEYQPALVEVLEQMKVGDTADPIETPLGFQIVHRTEVTPRKRYAYQQLLFEYEPSSPADSGQSRATRFASAQRRLAEILAKPSEFERIAKLGHFDIALVTQGREPPELTAALESLELDSIAKVPVEVWHGFALLRRLDPNSQPQPPTVVYELPRPEAPDIAAFVRANQSAVLASTTRALFKDLRAGMAFPAHKDKAVEAAGEKLVQAYESAKDGEARVRAMLQISEELRATLGETDYVHYGQFVKTWATNFALGD